MFFEEENLAVEIFDVLEFYHDNVHNVGNRPFHALSYRIEADTHISTATQRFHAKGGSLMYFPKNCAYRRESKNEHSIVIHFELYNRDFHEIELFLPSNNKEIEGLFREMLAVNHRLGGSGLQKSRIFFEILASLRKETEDGARSQGALGDTEAYIAENLSDPDLTVAQLADRLYMSEVTFRKYFWQQFFTSPKEYILKKRFEHSFLLLNTREYSIADVARLCGFTDAKHFSTLFKKRYDVSPSEMLRGYYCGR